MLLLSRLEFCYAQNIDIFICKHIYTRMVYCKHKVVYVHIKSYKIKTDSKL